MSVFICCEWMSQADTSLGERIAEAAGVLGDPLLTTIIGARLYRLGRSKTEALSRSVSGDALAHVETWRRVPLIPGRTVFSVDLWNGRDDSESANLSIAIHMPPSHVDAFVVSGLNADYLRSAYVAWSDVLAFAESLALKLGGVARVTSHELLDFTKERMASGDQRVAYAAFWGVDRSGNNSGYRALMKAATAAPFCCVAANSWEEMHAPKPVRLREITGLLGQELTM